MVKIDWKNKFDISNKIEEYRVRYENYFHKVDLHSGLNDLDSINPFELKNWTNKIFWGDNFKVLHFLLNQYEEKIDLIYIDPPFYSGANYQILVKEKDQDYSTVAYYDYWDKDLDSYLQMLYENIILFRKLLSKTGLLFIHLDWHASHYIKIILDDVFGPDRFINNIIWYYYNKYSAGKKNLPRAHDDILVYSKTDNYTFNELRIPRKKPRKQLKRENINGVLKNAKDENGKVIYRIVTDKKMDDVWKIPCLQPASKEWTGYPTQKHNKLIERILRLGSNEGDLIADFFCGSGTTLLEAEKLKRRWIGCDQSQYSIYLTHNRINRYQQTIGKSSQSFDIFSHLSENEKKIIESGFFSKDIKIKRKK